MFQDLFGKQPLIVSLDINHEIDHKIATLVAAGLTSIELHTHSASYIAHLRQQYPNLKIGIGNILNLDQLHAAYALKPDFMSTLGMLPSILKTASVYHMLLLPGVATFTDAMQAMELGFYNVRVFPGDLHLCKQLNQYNPQLKLYPIDINWEHIEQFLDLPSVAAVGLSNPSPFQMLQISESLHI